MSTAMSWDEWVRQLGGQVEWEALLFVHKKKILIPQAPS